MSVSNKVNQKYSFQTKIFKSNSVYIAVVKCCYSHDITVLLNHDVILRECEQLKNLLIKGCGICFSFLKNYYFIPQGYQHPLPPPLALKILKVLDKSLDSIHPISFGMNTHE